jgi:hypothetical protein
VSLPTLEAKGSHDGYLLVVWYRHKRAVPWYEERKGVRRERAATTHNSFIDPSVDGRKKLTRDAQSEVLGKDQKMTSLFLKLYVC